MSDRKGLYKNSDRNFESLRRNRQDHSVEIRKVKKDDQLQKRRNILLADLSDVTPEREVVNKTVGMTVKAICKLMKSKDEKERLDAVVACRKALSTERNPPIEKYFREGAVEALVSVLKEPGQMEEIMTFEAAWALTNIASGESRHTDAVVAHGAIDLFISLIDHRSDRISEQSVWALANIAGDSAKDRDLIVSKNVVPVIIKAVRRFWSNKEIIKQLSWFFSNLCRHKSDTYPVMAITDLLPVIKEILLHHTDNAIHVDMTWALSYATDNCEGIIDLVISHNFLPMINSNLRRSNEIVVPSIRVMGNIVAGSDLQASAAINSGVIESMNYLLSSDNARIVKESCWLLSNISAGTEDQVMTLIKSNVILSVLNVLLHGDYKCQKEAVWVISNMITCHKDDPKLYLLNNDIFKYLIPLLSCDDTKVVTLILYSIKALLGLSETYNELEQCISVFEAAGGIDVIEELQNHSSDEVYHLSYELVKEYFGAEDEDENEQKDESLQKFAF